MNTVIVREYGDYPIPNAFILDLSKTAVKDCIGCWSCWQKTPGRCVHKDLDEFYRNYLNADNVIFFSTVTQGFVSGNLKTLFDRMIPHYLPYITYKTGESMHVKRYQKYPDIQVYYQGEFPSDSDRKIYEDYISRTFYQFYSEKTIVKPIEQFQLLEVI